MIDSYSFGEITISGKRYTSDVIIFEDTIKDDWWRREGHSLDPADLSEVISAKPEVLVVGTGNSGLMKIPPETADFIKSKGIELIAQPTTDACQTYNKLSKSKKVIACLHLTC